MKLAHRKSLFMPVDFACTEMLNDNEIGAAKAFSFHGVSCGGKLLPETRTCSACMNNFQSLAPDEIFQFSCHQGIACFNRCCRDLNHALTPYDIVRLKKGLKLSSSAFLKNHTLRHIGPASGLPIVTINMPEQDNLQCPFVNEQGCSVYADRPGFCRIYPMARILKKRPNQSVSEESYMLIKEPHCLGFLESKPWTAKAWEEDQSVQPYNEMSDLLMEIIASMNRSGRKELADEERELFYLACYDTDRFRDFAFEKQLWEACHVKGLDVEELEQDDTALLRFAMAWIKEQLFGKGQG
jgi:Fe-S-cluster containining protein